MNPSDTPAASANDGIPTIVKHHKVFFFAICSKKEMWNVVAFHLDQLALG